MSGENHDLTITIAACFMMADAALREWRLGKFAECLVIAHAAQQSMARLRKMMEDTTGRGHTHQDLSPVIQAVVVLKD